LAGLVELLSMKKISEEIAFRFKAEKEQDGGV